MKWYVTVTSFYNDGRVTSNIVDVVESREKPDSQFKESRRCDIYVDYFASKREAEKHVRDAKMA